MDYRVAYRGFRAVEGSEPPATVNPDPPRLPGRGDDVDPHVRAEQVGPMVPVIALEGDPLWQ